ncbi:MAG: hypothetical protein MJZ60_08705 [Bacteroidaceae bacterium]|nr:hypothetical protein [Bacteroidaceae bacterium]
MINVANPIYDAVFKYLMEDNRVAKTLLSALLKREVTEVEVRKHEYSNGARDKISMFRIDFGAQVRQDDGSLKLILIELQKTWLETETLRFRQYLGMQYADPANIIKDENPEGYGIPMVTVYLLGHRVGDIEEPVVYVNHKSYDYDGNEVSKGVPDPFIESLVHDSIVVQIPLLRGQVNNRLEHVLSVFDQTHKDKHNRQLLNIDERSYVDDEEMTRILNRLLSAASDAKVRQDMNVEEEYFQAIENRDTAIMLRDQKIAERDALLAEQGAQLAEQGAQLAEQGAQLAEQGAQLAEQGAQLAEQDAQLAEKDKALLGYAKALRLSGMSFEEISSLTTLPVEVLKSNLD